MKGLCKDFQPKVKQCLLFEYVGSMADGKHCKNCKLRDKCEKEERV